jgi:hypothetical protein
MKHNFRFVQNLVSFLIAPARYLNTFYSSDHYAARPLYGLMCGYNEQENIVASLDSLVGKLDGLIFIDKNGALEKIVKTYSSLIEIDYETRPDLNLRESRLYALSKIPLDSWVILVDADELVLLSREELEALMVRRVCYRTKMDVTLADEGVVAQNDYHPFLMFNDGSIYFREKRDVPRYTGRYINLDQVCKENRSWSKNTRHLFYRIIYWKAWQYSGLKAGPIEDYIRSVAQELPTDEEVAEWYEEFKKNPAGYRAITP